MLNIGRLLDVSKLDLATPLKNEIGPIKVGHSYLMGAPHIHRDAHLARDQNNHFNHRMSVLLRREFKFTHVTCHIQSYKTLSHNSALKQPLHDLIAIHFFPP